MKSCLSSSCILAKVDVNVWLENDRRHHSYLALVAIVKVVVENYVLIKVHIINAHKEGIQLSCTCCVEYNITKPILVEHIPTVYSDEMFYNC